MLASWNFLVDSRASIHGAGSGLNRCPRAYLFFGELGGFTLAPGEP